MGFSWPGSHRNVNRLLPDEALQTDCSRGHRLDQNLPAWLSDWAAADLYSGVSEAMVRGSGGGCLIHPAHTQFHLNAHCENPYYAI